jgi:hypothetical protein
MSSAGEPALLMFMETTAPFEVSCEPSIPKTIANAPIQDVVFIDKPHEKNGNLETSFHAKRLSLPSQSPF